VAPADTRPPVDLGLLQAAEWPLWSRALAEAGRDPSSLMARVVVALLAARTAVLVQSTRPERERQRAPELTALLGGPVSSPAPAPSVALARLAGRLVGEPVSLTVLAEALALDAWSQGWCLAAPVELLLTSGGDGRLVVDSETGLNCYGCAPRPRPEAITFASTTATSVSPGAFGAGESLRQRLIDAAAAGQLEPVYAGVVAEVRAALAARAGAPAGSAVILTPSGTDAEFYALALTLALGPEPVTNILIAPQESGRSVELSAAGRHYGATTPTGEAVTVGEPVDSASAARTEVVAIPLRDARGELLAEGEVTAAVEQAVARALAAGRRVLLHRLDSSKTGLMAPAAGVLESLGARHPGAVECVIDASQWRLGAAALAAYLEQGAMVIVTGSKFFTGPPFAGALLVPAALARRLQAIGETALPAGFGLYSERHCWPDDWQSFCRALAPRVEPGLLLRWWAALWQIEAFQRAPASWARRVLGHFMAELRATLSAAPEFRLIPTAPPVRPAAADGWDSLETIFTFELWPAGADRPLDQASLQRLYHWLNRDLSAALPPDASDEERELAALCGHIGQPVLLGTVAEGRCGLRLAAGARLVSESYQAECQDGSGWAHLAGEIADARRVLDKCRLLLRLLPWFTRHPPA